MTKKHFNAMAIQFAQLRTSICKSNLSVQTQTQQLVGLEKAIAAYCEVAKQFNSNFDSSFFVEFINDIFFGKRDANGKKIRQTKKGLTHVELCEALIAQRKAKA